MHFLIYLFHAELTSLNCEIVAIAAAPHYPYRHTILSKYIPYQYSIVPNNLSGYEVSSIVQKAYKVTSHPQYVISNTARHGLAIHT